VYERVRHERGVQVKRTSREAGLLYEFCGVKGEGRDLEKVGVNLGARMPWIWEYDTEGELKRALAEVEQSREQ
jgi:salicylate hydroxylase